MANLSPKKIAIFDIDGTLIVESHRLRAQAESVSGTFGSSSAELQAVIYAFFSVNDYMATTKPEMKHNIPVYMEMIGDKIGIPITPGKAEELAVVWTKAYNDSHNIPELFPDVVECLRTLSERGFALVVASGSTLESRQVILQTTRINHFFSRIFATTDVGFQKQDIRFWQTVVHELDLNEDDQVAVIGNQLNDDIQNPIVLGFSAFLINRPDEFKKILEESIVRPTAVFTNFSDLINYPYFLT